MMEMKYMEMDYTYYIKKEDMYVYSNNKKQAKIKIDERKLKIIERKLESKNRRKYII